MEFCFGVVFGDLDDGCGYNEIDYIVLEQCYVGDYGVVDFVDFIYVVGQGDCIDQLQIIDGQYICSDEVFVECIYYIGIVVQVDEESVDDGGDDIYCGNCQWIDYYCCVKIICEEDCSENYCCNNGYGIGFEQISSYVCIVVDIIVDIVSDGGSVVWIIFWDIGFDFVDYVVIYVSIFGEDVVVQMGEDGDQGCVEVQGNQSVDDCMVIGFKVYSVGQQLEVFGYIQQCQVCDQYVGDGVGVEGDSQVCGQIGVSGLGCVYIGVD